MTAPFAAPATVVDDVLGADPGCPHTPPCPAADAANHDAAHVMFHDEVAGYSLLCNGVICFCDTGELVPDADATYQYAGECGDDNHDGRPLPHEHACCCGRPGCDGREIR